MQRAAGLAIKLVELLREGQSIGEEDHENAAALEAIEAHMPPIVAEQHLVQSVGAWVRQRQAAVNDIHALYLNTVATSMTYRMYTYGEKMARRKLVGYYNDAKLDADQRYDARAEEDAKEEAAYLEKEEKERNEEEAKLQALDDSPMIRLVSLDKNRERALE